eukprot:scaffold139479_cov241-Phaeocystis_antarctica.AAC.1
MPSSCGNWPVGPNRDALPMRHASHGPAGLFLMVCFHHGSESASASTRCSSTRCSPWLNAS